MKKLEEVMARFGSRPALIRMASVGDYFGDAAPYRIEDGVGIIDISGPLSNAKWSWGGTTYGEIQDQCKIAAADPNVRGVALNVNSPGGETDNAFETAAVVAQLAAKKPVYAVAATMAYSAAYLIASQAEKIYCTQISGGVGSIGVYCAHVDYSEMLKREGVKITLISAGDGKTAGNPYEPLDDEDQGELQDEINRLYAEFVSAVATGRGIDSASVIKIGAKCYDGAQRAMAAGLADAPGDLTQAWVDMCASIQQGNSPLMQARKSFAASAANSKEKTKMEQPNTTAETKTPTAAEIETLVAQARTDGYGDAAQVVDLCVIAGNPGLAAKFIGEKKTVAEVRTALLASAVKTQQDTNINTDLMPGTDAAVATQGKAKPWGEVLSSLGLTKSSKPSNQKEK